MSDNSSGQKASGRTDDDPTALILIVAGAVVVGGPTALAMLTPDLPIAGRAAKDWPGWFKDQLLQAWATWWPLVLLLAVLVVAAMIARLLLRLRGRRRAGVTDLVAAELGKVMPADWSPEEHLKIRRWAKGNTPAHTRVWLTPQCPDHDPEWRGRFVKAARARLGELGPIQWPAAGRRRRRLDLHSGPTITAGDVPAEQQIAGQLEPSLAGYMKNPQVKVNDVEGGIEVTIGYDPTHRDNSPAWRRNVVDLATARLGGSFRDNWDRQNRTLTLAPVPPLPKIVPWSTAYQSSLELVRTYTTSEEVLVLPYGTDESGYVVAWEASARQPHCLVVGKTGSGKTEVMKAIIDSALAQGVLVVIVDPKAQDMAEYLGKPGVLCVSTDVVDRAGALEDIMAEVNRRNAALALRKLTDQHPEFNVKLPPQSAIDQVPVLVVVDEATQNTMDLQKWWSALSKDDRQAIGGTAAAACPFTNRPTELAQLARAARVHLLMGLQRADAAHFGGGSTAIRDNLPHIISMARVSPLSSEMAWGDRATGVNVVINGPGEGMSNGLRIANDGKQVSINKAGRFKSWYPGDVAETADFWTQVKSVAPDGGLINLPGVSDAAKDPKAAVEALLRRAYGDAYGEIAIEAVPETKDAAEAPLWPSRSDAIAASAAAEPAAAAGEQDEKAPATPVGGPTTAPADEDEDEQPVVEVDSSGRQWVEVRASEVETDDRIMLEDGTEDVVEEVDGWVEDEISGDNVYRLTLASEGIVDLGEDEMVSRLGGAVTADAA